MAFETDVGPPGTLEEIEPPGSPRDASAPFQPEYHREDLRELVYRALGNTAIDLTRLVDKERITDQSGDFAADQLVEDLGKMDKLSFICHGYFYNIRKHRVINSRG